MSHDMLAEHVAELRRAFDESFARPRAPDTEPEEDWLGLRAAEHALAVRLLEAGGVVARPPITALPDAPRGQLGVGAIGTKIVVLYDLACLLDPGCVASARPWVLLCRAEPTVGLVFDKVDGFARLTRDATRSMVPMGERHRPAVELAGLLATLAPGGSPSDSDSDDLDDDARDASSGEV